MNSGESLGLVSEAGGGDGVDFVSISWCFASPGRARVSRGVQRLGHSSSELSGVLGTSLEQVDDVLVREGAGEHDRDGDRCGMARGRGGGLYAALTSTAIRNLSTASTAQDRVGERRGSGRGREMC